ncbi:MAG: RNA polymerase sigma factor [Solirubrobacteraceae bacterium]|nr:RNA polymerase sigma factor [Solirubrobacteraceae bacterium]
MEASAISAPAAGAARSRATGRFLRLRSDEQLVALFRAGDEAAFQLIHDRYRQRLFAYTRQMLGGSPQDAEDALQDVFLRAYGALRADSRPVSLRAWLYRVAHNRCIDHLRRPVPPAAEIFEMSRRPLHDPIVEAERREDLRQLVKDVSDLPEQQRSALLMREMDGLSYQELAGALDVTVPAVKSLLVRARIGLVEAGEARNTACVEVRESIALSHGRGVRATGLARRHMRECTDCSEYRGQLKALDAKLAALNPSIGVGPFAGLAQILGWGSAGTSAVTGGGVAMIGGGGAAVTKMVVVVGCVAVTAGGAHEVRERMDPVKPPAAESGKNGSSGASQAAAAGAATLAVHRLEPITLPTLNAPAATAKRRPAREKAAESENLTVLTKLPPEVADEEEISPHADPYSLATAAGGGAAAPEETPTPSTEKGPAAETTSPAESTPAASEPSALSATPEDSPEIDDPTVSGPPGGAQAGVKIPVGGASR